MLPLGAIHALSPLVSASSGISRSELRALGVVVSFWVHTCFSEACHDCFGTDSGGSVSDEPHAAASRLWLSSGARGIVGIVGEARRDGRRTRGGSSSNSASTG